MIKYDKLFARLKDAGINTTKVKQDGIIAQNTFYKIRRGEPTALGYEALNRLCALLDCQPGDLMEWVPDLEPTEEGGKA